MLEPWITPSIFEEVNIGENKGKIVDEYTYAQYVEPSFYQERLTRHAKTFKIAILVKAGSFVETRIAVAFVDVVLTPDK